MGQTPQPSIAVLLAGLIVLPAVQESKSEIRRMDVLQQDVFICNIHPNCGTECTQVSTSAVNIYQLLMLLNP